MNFPQANSASVNAWPATPVEFLAIHGRRSTEAGQDRRAGAPNPLTERTA